VPEGEVGETPKLRLVEALPFSRSPFWIGGLSWQVGVKRLIYLGRRGNGWVGWFPWSPKRVRLQEEPVLVETGGTSLSTLCLLSYPDCGGKDVHARSRIGQGLCASIIGEAQRR
jgi:hypothetical protein